MPHGGRPPFRFSLARLLATVTVFAGALGGMIAWQGRERILLCLVVACGWAGITLLGDSLKRPQTAVNLGWCLVGAFCGWLLGDSIALWMENPYGLRMALVVHPLVGAMIGTGVGWIVAVVIEENGWRLQNPWVVWFAVVVIVLVIWAFSPPIRARE